MRLRFSFSASSPAKIDTAVICVYENKKFDKNLSHLDTSSQKYLQDIMARNPAFEGKQGQILKYTLPKGKGPRQVILLGVGQAKKLNDLACETLGGMLYPALVAHGATDVHVRAPQHPDMTARAEKASAHMAYGMMLRGYRFDKYKTEKSETKKPAHTLPIHFVTPHEADAKKTFKTLEAVAQGIYLARDVMNEPPNILYPESYAAIIRKELKPLGISVEILDMAKMKKLGFGAHLAVGQGSARKPCVVVMRWNGKPSAKNKPPIAFVGKGVTFDTGGISIKPAAGMEDMKMDMGGSAAVVGLMKALAGRKAKVNVVGIVGLAENMPSHNAVRPGDIVTSLSGKTIEVFNTDAEGRLVLCDALTYVQRTYKPSHIIDLATLTGAIMVALGMEYCGAFVNNDKLWQGLNAASQTTGEKLWRMPLDEAYRKAMDGVLSDLNNMGNAGRYGGACTAAGFLERFIEKDTPWAHLDIAGKMMQTKDMPSGPKGGAGFGVKLLNQFVADQFET
ncbi:MAG: leucyl aminopeptidase [Alphaproteobacteria bacterium]|nr:leucyl aminopeptidase [Alphaproteobacteria bacterium]